MEEGYGGTDEEGEGKAAVLIAFVLFTFANGFGGSIISNYFKGVYQVDSVQRGLLEIPRELPGVVGVFVITALSGCGI